MTAVVTGFANSTTWQCPANVYYVDVACRGGGGGGGGSGDVYHLQYGSGGAAGTYNAANLVAVTPGTFYNITIGNGGTAGDDGAGGTGGTTTVLGVSATGGAGGGTNGTAPTVGAGGGAPLGGGAGSAGANSGTGNGAAGGAASGGGGGGSAKSTFSGSTWLSILGGAGGKGYATITYTLPTPAFTGTPTSGQKPLVVDWDNTSADTVSYYWDFGNSTNSTDEEPANTTYTLPGAYTVTLTCTNTYGVAQLVRTNYINVSRIPYSYSFIMTADNLRGV